MAASSSTYLQRAAQGQGVRVAEHLPPHPYLMGKRGGNGGLSTGEKSCAGCMWVSVEPALASSWRGRKGKLCLTSVPALQRRGAWADKEHGCPLCLERSGPICPDQAKHVRCCLYFESSAGKSPLGRGARLGGESRGWSWCCWALAGCSPLPSPLSVLPDMVFCVCNWEAMGARSPDSRSWGFRGELGCSVRQLHPCQRNQR